LKVAIVGSGIAGLGAAFALGPEHAVTVFEADSRAGGHANSVPVSLNGVEYPVDTGFLVLNENTYPRLLALFDQLNVELAESDMSFSSTLHPSGLEWAGSDLNTLFAQRRNIASPRFLRMLVDIIRFNREATRVATSTDTKKTQEPLGDWLSRQRYGSGFHEWYLLPMAAAIWSCPVSTMQKFPVGSFLQFFHNHGLLQVSNRPQWFTVRGGSQQYVSKILATLDDVRLATPVLSISRENYAHTGKVQIRTKDGTEAFDAVILACHSDQSLKLLQRATRDERDALQSIPYQPNKAWLHTDATQMPKQERAWSAWNYRADTTYIEAQQANKHAVSVTYWLNKLQPLPFESPVLLTLNPVHDIDPTKVLRVIDYEHPVFGAQALPAQTQLQAIQGENGTWFCGAWMGYGFHEDGLKSGQTVAQSLNQRNSDLQTSSSNAAA
jgi:predicted NAD/FAD-binding protein